MIEKNKITATSEENKTLYELKNTNGIAIDQNRLKRFQAAFRGEMIHSGDTD